MDLAESMKIAALEAVDASKPVQVCFGVVLEEDPLKIILDQKLILEKQHLILTRNVMTYNVDVEYYWETEEALTTAHTHPIKAEDIATKALDVDPLGNEHPPKDNISTQGTKLTHTHEIGGRKTMKLFHQLYKGDRVVLLRVQGGQKYIVLDKVGEM